MLAEWEREQLVRIERGLKFDYPISTRRWARLHFGKPGPAHPPLGIRLPWAWLAFLLVTVSAGVVELVLSLLARDYLTAFGAVVCCYVPVASSVLGRRTNDGNAPSRR